MTPEQRTHLQRAGIALVGVLLLVVGFSAGRFSAPLKVETREVERVVFRDLLVEDITKGFTFAKTVEKTVWRNVETRPDGSTVDRSIVHEGSRQDSTATETAKRSEEHGGSSETEKTSVTTLRPDWRLGALIGGRFSGGPAGLVAGGIAERRIIGGVSVGLWGAAEIDPGKPAVTGGMGGAALLVEF